MTRSDVFCDWLDVTYSPDDHPVDEVQQLLQSMSFNLGEHVSNERSNVAHWSTPDRGLLHITVSKKHVRISASGGCLLYTSPSPRD